MINEANDHPRYAVDVQRDQSKPGHPHATVTPLTYTVPKQKARGKKEKKRNTVKQTVTRLKNAFSTVSAKVHRFFLQLIPVGRRRGAGSVVY